MASGTTLGLAFEKISRDHLECGICQERYTQPKILECLHSFCEECLNQHYKSRYEGEPKIPCPVCQWETELPETGVLGLKTNLYVTSLIKDVALQEQVAKAAVTCDICGGDKEATHRCIDCSKSICGDCLRAHKQFPDLSKHTVATLEDIRQGRVEAQQAKQASRPECKNHPGEVKRFFCETCEELICRDCTVVDHRASAGHRYINSSAASRKLRQSLTQYIPKMDQNKKALQQALQDTDKLKNELTTNIETCIREMSQSVERMRANLTAEEKRIRGEITQCERDRMQIIETAEKDIKTLLLRSQHSMQIAEDVTKTASISDFLSLYPEISRDLQALSVSTPPQINKTISSVRFLEDQGTDAISLGGVLGSGLPFGPVLGKPAKPFKTMFLHGWWYR